MLGIRFAQSMGIVFSDATIKWMLRETMTYGDDVIARVNKEGYDIEINAWWLQGEDNED